MRATWILIFLRLLFLCIRDRSNYDHRRLLLLRFFFTFFPTGGEQSAIDSAIAGNRRVCVIIRMASNADGRNTTKANSTPKKCLFDFGTTSVRRPDFYHQHKTSLDGSNHQPKLT